MALLSDVYGDDFAKEMKAKNIDYLQKPKPPPPPPPSPEDIERAKKFYEEVWDEFNDTITIGNFVIEEACYQSFPCQHYCNGELKGARTIYKLLKDAGLVNDVSLTQGQKNAIKHFEYQVKDEL